MTKKAKDIDVPIRDGMPTSDQRRAVAHLSSQARRAGRTDIAKKIVVRAKAAKRP